MKLLALLALVAVACAAPNSGVVVKGPSGVVTDHGAVGPHGNWNGHGAWGWAGHDGWSGNWDGHWGQGAWGWNNGGWGGHWGGHHGVAVVGPHTVPATVVGPAGKVHAAGLWGPTHGWAHGHHW